MEEAGYIDRVIEAIKAAGENAVEITGDKGIKLIADSRGGSRRFNPRLRTAVLLSL